MAQVYNIALLTAGKAFDHLLDLFGDNLVGTVDDAGVQIALESDFSARDLDSELGVPEPVERNGVVAAFRQFLESVPSALGKDRKRHSAALFVGGNTKLGKALGQLFRDLAKIGQRELAELGRAKLAGPRFKDLENLSAGNDLLSEELNGDISDALQKSVGFFGVGVQPSANESVKLGRAAFGHVNKKGEGASAKAKQRHAAVELLAGEVDGLESPVEFLENVDGWRSKQSRDVFRGTKRIGEERASAFADLDMHAHCLGNDQDVTENDGSVDQAVVAIDGLDGDFRGDFSITASLEKVQSSLDFFVFRKITTSLSLLGKVRSWMNSIED